MREGEEAVAVMARALRRVRRESCIFEGFSWLIGGKDVGLMGSRGGGGIGSWGKEWDLCCTWCSRTGAVSRYVVRFFRKSMSLGSVGIGNAFSLHTPVREAMCAG